MLRTDEPMLTIQEVARRTGFSEPTLRYYERIGLFGPVPRDESSGHRCYDEQTVHTVESLACLRSSGMPIEEMRQYLELLPLGRQAAGQQYALFAKHAARVGEELDRLRVRHRYLQAKAELWAARERGDAEAEARAIADVHGAVGELR